MSENCLDDQVDVSSDAISNQKKAVRRRPQRRIECPHVFSSGQNLYFYYEVYDPGREAGDKNAVLRISEVGVADQVSWI